MPDARGRDLEIDGDALSDGIKLRTGETSRVTVSLPQFFYLDGTQQSDQTIDRGFLYLLASDGSLAQTFPMLPGGRCPSAAGRLRSGGSHRLLAADTPPPSPEELRLLADSLAEVRIGSRVFVPSPPCFEFCFELGPDDQLTGRDRLTLQAVDGSYTFTHEVQPARHRRGDELWFRFFRLPPRKRYRMIWHNGETGLCLFDGQTLGLGRWVS